MLHTPHSSQRARFVVVALTLCFVSPGAACKTSPTPPPPPPVEQELEQLYVIAGVALHSPLTIQDAEMFADGGTLTLTLVDPEGTSLQVCNDSRMALVDLAENHRQREQAPRHIYVGGPHPTSASAKPLAIGGSEERELCRALRDWSDRYERTGVLRITVRSEYKIVKKEEQLQTQLRNTRSFLAGLERRLAAG